MMSVVQKNISPDFQVSFRNEAQITRLFDMNLSPEMAMIQIQILMTKDFNDQAEAQAEEIQFYDKIKNNYRDQTQVFHRFLAKNHNTSRKDGKVYIEATAEELTELMSAATIYNPTYDAKKGYGNKGKQGLMISNDGENNELTVHRSNDLTSSDDLAEYFGAISDLSSNEEKIQEAQKFGGDDNNLFGYYGSSNNKTESGEPKFAVYLNSVENIQKQVEAESSRLDAKIEMLNTSLSTLLKQRETAVNSLQTTITELAQIREGAIRKV